MTHKTQLLAASFVIFMNASLAHGQSKLANPAEQHLANGGGSAPVVRQGAQPGEVRAEFTPMGGNNNVIGQAQQYQAAKVQQAAQINPCDVRISAQHQRRPVREGVGPVVQVELCVDNVIALDSTIDTGIGMPSKGYDLPAQGNPKCKVDVITPTGGKMWLVSDSDSICQLLIAAHTTHPMVTVSGFMTSYTLGAISVDRDGTVYASSATGETVAYIGLNSASFR